MARAGRARCPTSVANISGSGSPSSSTRYNRNLEAVAILCFHSQEARLAVQKPSISRARSPRLNLQRNNIPARNQFLRHPRCEVVLLATGSSMQAATLNDASSRRIHPGKFSAAFALMLLSPSAAKAPSTDSVSSAAQGHSTALPLMLFCVRNEMATTPYYSHYRQQHLTLMRTTLVGVSSTRTEVSSGTEVDHRARPIYFDGRCLCDRVMEE